jgi:tRNA G46 methylase TrmB
MQDIKLAQKNPETSSLGLMVYAVSVAQILHSMATACDRQNFFIAQIMFFSHKKS